MPADTLGQGASTKNEQRKGDRATLLKETPDSGESSSPANRREPPSPRQGQEDRAGNDASKGHSNRLKGRNHAKAEPSVDGKTKPPTQERTQATSTEQPAPEQAGGPESRRKPRRGSRLGKPRGGDKGKADDKPGSEAETTPLIAKRLAAIGAASTIALSVVVLGISMPHLASGVSHITDCQFYTAIFMACVFDLSQIAAEYSVIVMPILGLGSRRLHAVCGVIIVACTVVSMIMNVRAFLEHVETPFGISMAYAWGCCLPVLVLLLVYLASAFVMRLQPSLPTGTMPAKS